MFIEAFFRRARKDPAGIAVVTESRSVTNAELSREVSSLARWLVHEGLSRDDIVGISIRDEYRNFVATLAAMRAGLGQIALPTHDPIEARGNTAKRLKLSAILADRPEDGLDGYPTLHPDFASAPALGREAIPARTGADDGCFYVSSSGTTGRAKIVPLSQRQLFEQAASAGIGNRVETLYRPTSIEFDNSRRHRLYCLAAGGVNLLLAARRMSVAETCARYGVTLLKLSAAQAMSLLDEGRRLPEWTRLQVRGSPVGEELRRRITRQLTSRLEVVYGTTEMGSVATAGPDDHAVHPATLGRLHSGVDAEIVDEDDRQVQATRPGAMRLRGRGMATRYHDDEEASLRAFRNGWFYPGDIGHFGEQGDLRFDGRLDEMMMLASINIFPAEIERFAETLPGVRECAAFSIKSGEFGDVPLLAVVSDGTTGAEALLAAARRALGLRAPRKVFLVDELPRTAEGKIRRADLRKLAEERAAA